MNCLRSLRNLLVVALLSQFQQTLAQPVAEQLLETHWRYTYTLHLETNSLVQQASEQWRHFLWFRFDGMCKQHLNGKPSESAWRLDNQQIHFPFRQKNTFVVARLNAFSLELEQSEPGGKATYIHHFTRVKSEDSPFAQQTNTLPVVQVQTVPLPEADISAPVQAVAALVGDDVCIELTGGGYDDGSNPARRDYITVTRTGRLVHEFERAQGNRLVQKANISKEELVKFLEWAVTEQRFFQLENFYDCKTPECEKRKSLKPAPVPLRLRIVYDDKSKMVAVSIWGLDGKDRRYISCPPELERIVDAVQRMANQVR